MKNYPESVYVNTPDGWNILHYTMSDKGNNSDVVEEKVRYLCRQYPNLVHERTNTGYTPLHAALSHKRYKGVSTLCRIDEEVVRDSVICNDELDHLSLPLYIMVRQITCQMLLYVLDPKKLIAFDY